MLVILLFCLYAFISFCILVFVISILISKDSSNRDSSFFHFESGRKKAGRLGEEKAYKYISQVLKDDDKIINNVEFTYNNQKCEIDYVVVNRDGVFIIEVKNYSGVIKGDANDRYWSKTKTSSAGYTYDKEFKNPLIQLKWHVGSLGKYLKSNGFRVWVKGYSMILNNERSHLDSDQILHNIEEIDKAIHTRAPENIRHLSKPKQDKIIELLNKAQ